MSSESSESSISQIISNTSEEFSNDPINLNHTIPIETNNFDESTESILLDGPEGLSGSSSNWKYILITFCLIGICLYIFKEMKQEKKKIKK
jgi:hypothetical protein|uniref:Uncharacterized protein n=1 Tax=viral metagenome TaxID=1070528 RepID=A0A6C0IUL9_9ZZZZ